MISHLYPDTTPSLNLNFKSSRVVDPRITFTRASTATYTDQVSGLVKTATVNTPRVEKDGFLLEEQRTNQVLQSQDFDNAAWSKPQRTSVTANAGVAPDGTTTADLMFPNNLSGPTCEAFQYFGTTTAAAFSNSVYAKASGKQWMRMTTAQGNLNGFFDVANGVIGQVSSGVNAQIEDVGNGWFRCSVSQESATAQFIYVTVCDADNSTAVTTNGTDGLLVWGGQFEAGSFPTSYIPTSGSTVTRSADVASMTGTNFSSWYNTNAVTIVGTQKDVSPPSPNLYDVVWGFGTGGSNRIQLRQRAGELKRGFYINGTNIAIAPLLYTKPNHTDKYTVGVAMDANGADQAAEGTSLATTNFTNATMPTISTLYFQTGVTGFYFVKKHLTNLFFYPKRVSKTELESSTK